MTAYKSSELGWADKIPSHWDVAKVCLVARLESGHTPSRLHPEYWVPNECTIPWFSLGDVWQLREGVREYLGETKEKISPRGMANSAARLLPKDTVVLSRTASVGFTGIMPEPMATTQDFANWICGPRLLPEFLLYAFRGMADEFQRMMMGSTHQTIYMPDIRRLSIPVPPREEQSRIVDLLRRRLPTLDALIAKKERLIELLQEKRQALITQAVTKGLDPNVPMRESRNPLLKKIPRHWEPWSVRDLLRMRHLEVQDGNHGELHPVAADYVDDGIPFLMANNVRGGNVDLVGCKFIPQQLADGLRIGFAREGDVLLTHKGTLGETAILPSLATPYAMLTPQVTYYRARALFDRRYLYFFMTSEVLQEQLRFISSVQSTRGYVGITAQRDLVLLVPPIGEQLEICDYLEPRVGQMDSLLAQIAQSILGLREYRQALITAAVTGKIDMSKAAA